MGNVIKSLTAVTLVSALLAGCAGGQGGPGEFGANKTTGGTILGAVGGGLAGAQFGKGKGQLMTTAAGTLLGAFIGNQVGASLDRADVAYANKAEQQAATAPVGQQVRWNNPDNGHSGSITPVRDGTDNSGRYCREYQTTVTVNGQQQQAYGTACRQPDGSWQVVQPGR
jgi:surface antigen